MIDRDILREFRITEEHLNNFHKTKVWLDEQLKEVCLEQIDTANSLLVYQDELKDLNKLFDLTKAEVSRLSQMTKSKELQDSIRLMMVYNKKISEVGNICSAYKTELKELKELESILRENISELRKRR